MLKQHVLALGTPQCVYSHAALASYTVTACWSSKANELLEARNSSRSEHRYLIAAVTIRCPNDLSQTPVYKVPLPSSFLATE